MDVSIERLGFYIVMLTPSLRAAQLRIMQNIIAFQKTFATWKRPRSVKTTLADKDVWIGRRTTPTGKTGLQCFAIIATSDIHMDDRWFLNGVVLRSCHVVVFSVLIARAGQMGLN
jgi:hypothetical protein